MSEYKIVNIDEIKHGPIRHNELPEIWHNEALSIYQLISEVEDSSFKHFEENFRRDLNYGQEITIWRCIATAYNTFVTARMIISLPEKKAAYKIAFLSSISSKDENDVKGDELISDDDAKFIYKIYHLMISQTFSNRKNKK